MNLPTLVLLIAVVSSIDALTCKPSGINCISPNQYQLCIKAGNYSYPSGDVKTCPEGQSCDDTKQYFPCQNVPPTTTPPPVTPPGCFGPDKYVGPKCYQYFECVSVYWWWEPRLVTCPEGEAFSLGQQKCVIAQAVNCHLDYVTTEPPTTPLPITTTTPENPPPCYGDHRLPSINCNEYYQCVRVAWWWEPRKLICPEGEAFNATSEICNPVEREQCERSFTPTSSTAIPTTTEILSTTPEVIPPCNGDERHPSPRCNEYYQCVQVAWWWEPRTVVCPLEEAFDEEVKGCVKVEPSVCPLSFTGTTALTEPETSSTTVVTTTVTELPEVVSPPECKGPGKFAAVLPGRSSDQYYKCVSVWWWWEPRLETCPENSVFDVSADDCVKKEP